MSAINQVLTLSTPNSISDLNTSLQSAIIICNRCWGRGFIRVYVHDHAAEASDIDNTCPVCCGTGRIQADIEIKWKSVK